MFKSLSDNYYTISALLPIVIVTFLVLLFPDFSKLLWDFVDQTNIDVVSGKTLFKHVNKEILFFLGFGYLLLVFLFWIYTEYKSLFLVNDYRAVITVMLSLSLPLMLFTVVVPFYLIGILITIIFISKYKHVKSRFNLVLGLLLAGVVIQGIGLFRMPYDLLFFLNNYHSFILIQFWLCILAFALSFFRFSSQEKLAFITIVFKFFFLFIVLHVVSYILLVNYEDKSLLSCLTFDKGYLNRSEIFQFSKYMHPSILSSLFLVIGGVTYASIGKGLVSIKKVDFIIYWFLLFLFVMIVQSRIGIIGYFLVSAIILFLEFSKRLSNNVKILITTLSIIIGASVVCFTLTSDFSSMFNDSSRLRAYALGYDLFKEHVFLGGGTLSEHTILPTIGWPYMHNDFLEVAIRHGLLGLLVFVSFILLLLWNSIKTKDFRILFLMIPTVLLMMTDSAFNSRYIVVFTVFLFVLMKDELKIKN